MVRWARAGVIPLVLAGLVALAGVVLGRIYADALLAQLVAGAAVGSVAVGVAVRRLPSWTVAPLSVLLLAGYTVVALRVAAGRADRTEPLPGLLADSLTNGIPRLLTAMIPVEATPDTVVVPVIAAWLAGLAGAELAVRSGRVLAGCAPAAALYAGALYVVGPNAAAATGPTLAFAGLVVVALATTAKPGDGTALSEVPATTRAAVRGRALVGAAAGLIVLAGLIAVVGPWVSGRVGTTPVDPRRYVEPPQVDSLDESPLNRISGWALSPEQKLLEVHPGGGAAAGQRLRLAVLPDYDGVTWRVGATYRNAGRVLPTPSVPPDAEVTELREDITVDSLTGRLLPAVPTPTSVEGARVAYDAATGTLIRPEALTPGLRYTVTSRVQTLDTNLLPTADSPSGDAVARFLTVGAGVPDPIQRLADQLADGNGAAFDRASAIEEFLSEHYRKVADAPSGHAYPNLGFFLLGPRDQGGQRGTSEQFAASFALLARLTGVPSRVVVGFDVPKGGGTVTAGNAIAWPEVLFDELGWVPFDPMPKSKDRSRRTSRRSRPRRHRHRRSRRRRAPGRARRCRPRRWPPGPGPVLRRRWSRVARPGRRCSCCWSRPARWCSCDVRSGGAGSTPAARTPGSRVPGTSSPTRSGWLAGRCRTISRRRRRPSSRRRRRRSGSCATRTRRIRCRHSTAWSRASTRALSRRAPPTTRRPCARVPRPSRTRTRCATAGRGGGARGGTCTQARCAGTAETNDGSPKIRQPGLGCPNLRRGWGVTKSESLAELLGGRRAALDATVPAIGFVAGWLAGGRSIWIGTVVAVLSAVAVSLWRLRRGDRPRAVLIGLLGVCLAALIALRTGRAEDFFLLQILSNAASALAWAVSIVIRWPLLGVVVGAVLGQKTRWRRDPALLRAYSRAGWVWVLQYVVRLAVFLPLYAAGQVVALGVARVALTWPLVAACLAASWWVIRRDLPPGHPGPRHPQDAPVPSRVD